MIAENGRVEEQWWFFGHADEKIGERGSEAQEEYDPGDPQGACDRADVAVMKRKADGDVALQGHAGQDERGGARGHHSGHDQRAAGRCQDLWEGIAHLEQNEKNTLLHYT